jgi:hypothetical protein
MSTADPAPIEDDGIERTPDPVAPPVDDGIERSPEQRAVQGIERPDWLVGADEGAAAEVARHDGPAPERPALKLHKPGPDGEDGGATRSDAPIGLPLSSRAAAERKKKIVPWAAAASSVPALRPDREGPSASLGRDLSDFPDAPALERVATTATGKRETPPRPTARDLESPPPRPRATPPPAMPAPTARPARPNAAAPPRESRAQSFDPEPEDGDEAPDAFDIPRAATRRAPPPPADAWWMVALDELRHNRRLQILCGVLVVAVATFMLWPRSEPGVSLGELRRHPDRYDGARVRVSGKVGQVYQVGGSYAFYLHQGRDTMVVFTRMRVPVERQHVSLSASVSTGFLDGLPRQSLFEESE